MGQLALCQCQSALQSHCVVCVPPVDRSSSDSVAEGRSGPQASDSVDCPALRALGPCRLRVSPAFGQPPASASGGQGGSTVARRDTSSRVPLCGFHERYTITCHIANGSFAEVYEAATKHAGRGGKPRHVAVKRFELSPADEEISMRKEPRALPSNAEHPGRVRDRSDYQREVEVLARLGHPHLLKMYECFSDVEYSWLILELCSGGDLFSRICAQAKARGRDGGAFDEAAARCLLRQMISALSYLHGNRVVHGDVKPENFLSLGPARSQEGGIIKLCDFGTAVWLNDERPRAMLSICTLSYTPPEVYARKGSTIFGDAWSLGVVLYAILVGLNPFRGQDDHKDATVRRIMAGEFNQVRPAWLNLSNQAQDIIRCLIVVDESRRLSCAEALQHPWVDRGTAVAAHRYLSPLSCHKDTIASYASCGSLLLSLLSRFAQLDGMQKLALMCCASLTPDVELISCSLPLPWYGLYFALDANGDGRLGFMELVVGLRLLLGDSVAPADAALLSLAQELDLDRSGEIEWAEWAAVALSCSPDLCQSEEPLQTAFRLLGAPSADGVVTAEDLAPLLATRSGDAYQLLRPWATAPLEQVARAGAGDERAFGLDLADLRRLVGAGALAPAGEAGDCGAVLACLDTAASGQCDEGGGPGQCQTSRDEGPTVVEHARPSARGCTSDI